MLELKDLNGGIMTTITRTFVATLLMIFSFSALAVDADKVLGYWWSPEQKSKVLITKTDGKYFGKIIAVRKESQDKRDTKNPDKALQDRKILGMEILSSFKFDGDDTWEDGKIYDPESGKTYKCKMWFEKDDVLKIRGYVGISLLGRTAEFTKVQGSAPHTRQENEPDHIHEH